MTRVFAGLLVVQLLAGCSGMYASSADTWESEGGRQTMALYNQAEDYASKARIEAQRAEDAVERTELAALRVNRKDIEQVDGILRMVKRLARTARATSNLVEDGLNKAYPLIYRRTYSGRRASWDGSLLSVAYSVEKLARKSYESTAKLAELATERADQAMKLSISSP